MQEKPNKAHQKVKFGISHTMGFIIPVSPVFDCSAEYRGISLNKSLMSGTDLRNQILGVITRY